MMQASSVGVIIIGRNEGARLIRCLSSVKQQAAQVVYVDSGSSDGSQEAASTFGAHLIELDSDSPFTAARARNSGLRVLSEQDPPPDYLQFIDGDCELQPGWLDAAIAYLEGHPKVAVACGRRRERFPEASVYNRLINKEWDTRVGQASACGGDALMRMSAMRAVGGFNPNLIAGEEPELCIRLRALGWTIWRLDAEMTLHDADLTRLSQWWKRSRRAGHAYAEGAFLHGSPPERHGIRQIRSALLWGVLLPIATLLGLFLTPWSMTLMLVWPAQAIRLGLRDKDWVLALFLTFSKLPEAQGILGYWWTRLRGARASLIEYK